MLQRILRGLFWRSSLVSKPYDNTANIYACLYEQLQQAQKNNL